jgi:hypothetical protein
MKLIYQAHGNLKLRIHLKHSNNILSSTHVEFEMDNRNIETAIGLRNI